MVALFKDTTMETLEKIADILEWVAVVLFEVMPWMIIPSAIVLLQWAFSCPH